MKRMISSCPCCHEQLRISTLQCPTCGTEIKNDFELSPFDRLEEKQYDFLLSFLKCRGSLKEVQTERRISYPTAKKQLDELLESLGLDTKKEEPAMEIDLRNLEVDRSSTKASEIIKAKLRDHGGHVTVFTARGLPCEIYAANDGKSFTSDKLPIKPPYEYEVFDVIVDLLQSQGAVQEREMDAIINWANPAAKRIRLLVRLQNTGAIVWEIPSLILSLFWRQFWNGPISRRTAEENWCCCNVKNRPEVV